MFSRADFDVVGFSSSDTVENPEKDQTPKTFKDFSCQTQKKVTDIDSQTRTTRSLEIQTDGIVQNLNGDYNVDNLASFLSRIYPGVMEELDKVEKSRAFTLYQSSLRENYDKSIKVIHTIQSETLPQIPKGRVSCIAWSCTDNVVMLGYESSQHTDWCTHLSSVDFFNIKTSDFNGRTPTYSIPTTSCVTALAAHPYEPAIVAVGTAGGEVHIWNLQKGPFDADIGNSIFHKDRVTKVSWENISSQLYLVSSSVDSHLFFYKVTPSISSVQLHERYLMTTETSELRAGILQFSFSIQPGVFAVALESGEIIHCSTFGAPNIPSSTAKNPVLRVMCKKVALVLDLKFSTHVEHIFLAIFTNNVLIGFSLKETAPLYEIYLEVEVLGMSWSPTQKDNVVLWGKSPKLYIYRGIKGTPLTQLEPDTTSLPLIKSASFCFKSSRLAVAGNDGKAMIYDIPLYF